MDLRLQELCTPTRQAERDTIIAAEQPPYVQGADWSVNREFYSVRHAKDLAYQEQRVVNKREAIQTLANMLKELKQEVEPRVQAVLDYINEHDLDSFIDFERFGYVDITEMLECDPVGVAVKWMASDHSC